MNLQNQPLSQLVHINVNELQQKCKSKRELYQFLSQDCKVYLPRIQSTNIYFLKQIIRSEKDYILRDSVKVSAVPHIEGLTIESLIEYAEAQPRLLRYLPDARDWLHMDRQWVCDILYTIDEQGLQAKINNALLMRKQKQEQNRDLIVDMRPEFALALQNCLNFSHERGRAVNLLKNTSKRKRQRNEIEDVKQEENELKQDKHQFLQKFKRLKEENDQMEQLVLNLNETNKEYERMYGNNQQNIQEPQFNI